MLKVRPKPKDATPPATFAVSASYALTSSYVTYNTGGIGGLSSVQPMQQPNAKVFYLDFQHGGPGPEGSLNVHILKS